MPLIHDHLSTRTKHFEPIVILPSSVEMACGLHSDVVSQYSVPSAENGVRTTIFSCLHGLPFKIFGGIKRVAVD